MQGGAVLAGETKIADLELARIVVEDVGGFEVAVEDPVVVQVCDAPQELLHQVLHLHQMCV